MSIKQKNETPVPLLLISDAPSCSSGLGRITRDLAIRIHTHLSDIFRVGVLGYGGPGSRKFGFQQYCIEGMSEWIMPTLPEVWEDFAGEERGIVLSIWDASRLMWFSQPARCEMLNNHPILRNWLLDAPFDRWGYFPIDAEGPNGKLSFPLNQTLLGFDRILAYGQWARDVIKRSIGESNALQRNIDFLPHGIDADVFYQRDRTYCRFKFGSITGAQTLIKVPQLSSIMDGEILIGIIATNQARKDWALALETVAIVAKERRVRLWIHTDVLERNWSIPALLADYELIDKTIISLEYLSDDKMAQAYSACDITLAPGAGEGFCFPLFESIACKTPCIHGNYGGAPEWMPPEFLVEPVAYRYEGLYSNKRPVFVAQDWADKVSTVLQNATHQQVHFNDALMWENLWPYWERWFREGWNG